MATRLTYPRERLVDRHTTDVAAMLEHLTARGYEISDRDCALAWRDYSATQGSPWLPSPERPDETVRVMLKFCAAEPAPKPAPRP